MFDHITYSKAYEQAHKDKLKVYKKAYYQAHKEQYKEYYQARKEEVKAAKKEYHKAHKEERKAYNQAHKEQHNEYAKKYTKSEVNSLGETKHSIRKKSQYILKKMNLHIPGYETHHCFGYEDASKFIYISKELHLKIHKYLRDNNISADTDHWMQIRDIVNSTDEFMYIKC